ncbi:chemotaxis protein CheD [Pseudomonas oryzihabitans]|nr:chemotaxis protein CheD [Pseudomonas psychrotolerans]KTT03217.1 chemotaxis protein CheD [Pseudomonas psychrotolerans]KTT11466.1 chemotaxis protein CheD [Pseudomonas psychrotolerans]KTT24149.1 chemotaxis protein CheD [Pseudomonas psychrotolerans]KTT35062.1 chemotaxis protein CheD [Pseudomonas psychrotolerans]
MAATAELFLRPGEWSFGRGEVRIRTILGSCVAFVFWHPRRRLGGVTHALLPTRQQAALGTAANGQYVDESLTLMLGEVARHGGDLSGYQVHVYGGGNMFPQILRGRVRNIGDVNVDVALAQLAQQGLCPVRTHVRGAGHRTLSLDLTNGQVLVRQVEPAQVTPPKQMAL